MKVLITRKIPSVAEELLTKHGFDVTVYKKNKPISSSELIKLGKNSDGLLTLLSDKIDKSVIDKIPHLKIIANYAVGFNNIDVRYAKTKGIIVTNTPDILTDATADIAMGLILACSRRFCEADSFMREGKFNGWKPDLFLGPGLKNKTLGIIGAGRIGQATALRAKAFGMKIIYFSRSKKPDFENELGAKKVSLSKLMRTADVISLHVPLTPDTYHLLDKEKLDLMKPEAIIVNTARGEVIDEKYLIKLLRKKKIFAAGFDVYEGEPVVNESLFKLKNVVLLPHIGSATIETRNKMAELAAKNIINVLKGKNPITPVNL